ncbi:MAG: 2,3-bisphosphoglycerate-dependent phosphoglycerate mutase [Hyphomicrobiaceae bacterium]|nr:2,3-bisphosphoglycerate-dependent phosphoglycerate mutase [Hyphomicrobiaceae bacterium]
MDNVLVLVRHGQSVWNAKNLFTGWKDVDLTDAGIEEARRAGTALKAQGIAFDIAYTSALIRAQRTLDLILEELGQSGLETIRDQALNERDYGDLVGLNKEEMARKVGAEQVHIWRRSFDVAPPGGESLKDTAERTLPYFEDKIMPDVLAGKNVIVAAHGNSLRSIVMKLDNLSQDEVTQLNLATGVPIVYRLNADGSVAEKSDLAGQAAA